MVENSWYEEITSLSPYVYLLQITFARGATINIVAYSVNVRVKFYSIEVATIYDAAYSVNLDLQKLFSTPVTKSKMSLFLVEITFARGRHR